MEHFMNTSWAEKKIIIAEGNTTLHPTLQKIFEDLGYQVRIFDELYPALLAINEERPQALLTSLLGQFTPELIQAALDLGIEFHQIAILTSNPSLAITYMSNFPRERIIDRNQGNLATQIRQRFAGQP
jgi:hypothetical protein